MKEQNMKDEFYSNCLIEAIKAKIKYKNDIKVILLKLDNGLCHFVWYDRRFNTIHDFQQIETVKHWYNLLWFKGRLRDRTYDAFMKWCKERVIVS